MKFSFWMLLFFTLLANAEVNNTGLLHIKSLHTVAKTVLRLEKSLSEQTFTSESRLNAGNWGESLELQIRPTWLLLLNHPQMGALMPCGRTVAIDLPLKVLVWEDEAGQTWISYNDLHYLHNRHGLNNCLSILDDLMKKFEESALAAAQEDGESMLPEGAQPPNTESQKSR